jgi:hypothetical protein
MFWGPDTVSLGPQTTLLSRKPGRRLGPAGAGGLWQLLGRKSTCHGVTQVLLVHLWGGGEGSLWVGFCRAEELEVIWFCDQRRQSLTCWIIFTEYPLSWHPASVRHQQETLRPQGHLLLPSVLLLLKEPYNGSHLKVRRKCKFKVLHARLAGGKQRGHVGNFYPAGHKHTQDIKVRGWLGKKRAWWRGKEIREDNGGNAGKNMNINAYMYMCVYMCKHICVYIVKNVYIHTCSYIHAYIHFYNFTYMYICIHIKYMTYMTL